MVRIIWRTVIFLGSAAIGLIVAASILGDDFTIQAGGFVIAVVIYAVIQSVISPFLAKVAAANARAFLGGVGLVATFVALFVATLFSDALTISGGVTTWVLASLIVWLVGAIATLLLPWALIKAGVRSLHTA